MEPDSQSAPPDSSDGPNAYDWDALISISPEFASQAMSIAYAKGDRQAAVSMVGRLDPAVRARLPSSPVKTSERQHFQWEFSILELMASEGDIASMTVAKAAAPKEFNAFLSSGNPFVGKTVLDLFLKGLKTEALWILSNTSMDKIPESYNHRPWQDAFSKALESDDLDFAKKILGSMRAMSIPLDKASEKFDSAAKAQSVERLEFIWEAWRDQRGAAKPHGASKPEAGEMMRKLAGLASDESPVFDWAVKTLKTNATPELEILNDSDLNVTLYGVESFARSAAPAAPRAEWFEAMHSIGFKPCLSSPSSHVPPLVRRMVFAIKFAQTKSESSADFIRRLLAFDTEGIDDMFEFTLPRSPGRHATFRKKTSALVLALANGQMGWAGMIVDAGADWKHAKTHMKQLFGDLAKAPEIMSFFDALELSAKVGKTSARMRKKGIEIAPAKGHVSL